MMNRRFAVIATLLGTAGAGLLATSPLMGEGEATLAERCEMLAGHVDGDLRISAASFYPEGREAAGGPGSPAATMPPHCLVEGMINERVGADGVTYGIGFELALPAQWNQRYLLQGGGGLNGRIRPPIGPVASGDSNALARGFAVASHDSGHKGGGFDASFMADQRASLDFAETAVLRVTLATRALTERFYGAAPHHSYMTGCSTGGREGMLASQRYPELFDGIVVGAPAMRPGYSNLAAEYGQMLLNQTLPEGDAGPAAFSPAERSVIDREILRQCDGLDGREDGMVMNVEACRAFDPAALQCAPGESTDCIAPARVEALRGAMAGYRDATGRAPYVPYPWDTGITWSGPGLPGFVSTGQSGPFGPATRARRMDVDARLHDIRWDASGRLTSTAYWTNLNAYLGHGGKMLFFHGVSDPWFSAFDTWDYFQRARAANGPEAWDDAARFYMVPGMGHCSGGNAFDSFDLLGPLVEWVEEGEAPGTISAARRNGGQGGMALCPHPSYAYYEGGDGGIAASYSCRMPEEMD